MFYCYVVIVGLFFLFILMKIQINKISFIYFVTKLKCIYLNYMHPTWTPSPVPPPPPAPHPPTPISRGNGDRDDIVFAQIWPNLIGYIYSYLGI